MKIPDNFSRDIKDWCDAGQNLLDALDHFDHCVKMYNEALKKAQKTVKDFSEMNK